MTPVINHEEIVKLKKIIIRLVDKADLSEDEKAEIELTLNPPSVTEKPKRKDNYGIGFS